MIQNAIQYTCKVLNQYVVNKFNLDETIVIANRIIDQKGVIPIENQNKIILSLIHAEQENVKLFNTKSKRLPEKDSITSASSSPEQYSIYILMTPSFEDYNETLKFLDTSISFFKKNPIIDRNNVTNLPDTIAKLHFEQQNGEGYIQVQNLWNAMGAKYQPSVIYKMRLLTIASDEIEDFVSKITAVSNTPTL